MYAEKLPPHDADAEEAVIGSLLIDGEVINRIAPLVGEKDFYRRRNELCYSACLSLYHRGESIDQISVARELSLRERLDEVGGPGYLSHVIAAVPTSVHAEHFARIVNRTATMRRLIDAAGDIAAIGYKDNPDTEQALEQAEDILFRVRNTHVTRDFVTIREVLDQYLEEASDTAPLDHGVAPIPTGFIDLDNALGRGMQRGDLFILAARPALGKSTLAMNIARNAAKQGALAAVVSLEMSCDQLALRLLSAESDVDSHLLRMGLVGEVAQTRVMHGIGALSDLAIYMDDSPAQTVLEMRSKLRRLHTRRSIDLVIVDYLQLISGRENRGENRVQELSDITRQLKAIARDLNVPVIAISQLSRAIEQRPDHHPLLSDLRESGSIEQDADVVAFIHRDDKYITPEQWEQRHPTDPYPENLAQLVIAKNRHGPTRSIHLSFDGKFSRFLDHATETATA